MASGCAREYELRKGARWQEQVRIEKSSMYGALVISRLHLKARHFVAHVFLNPSTKYATDKIQLNFPLKLRQTVDSR